MPAIHSTGRLIAVFVAALCTGVYFCTLLCVRWIVFKDEGWSLRHSINKGFLGATLAIAVFSTIHTVLAVTTSVAAIHKAESPGLSSEPDKRVPWESVVMCTVVNASVLMVDAFLIYRCWAVTSYQKRKVLFPSLFWIGEFICTILQLYGRVVQTDQIARVWTPVNMSVGPGTVLTPFWGCTIVVNVYATGVIVYHIWVNTGRRDPAPMAEQPSISTETSSTFGQSDVVQTGLSESRQELRFIVRVLIESGALYLLITIPHFAVWWTSSGLAIITLGWANLPVVGTAFNLTIVRTARHRAAAEKKAVELL